MSDIQSINVSAGHFTVSSFPHDTSMRQILDDVCQSIASIIRQLGYGVFVAQAPNYRPDALMRPFSSSNPVFWA